MLKKSLNIILLITAIFVLNACTDSNNSTTTTNSSQLKAPTLSNLPSSTTKELVEVKIKTLPNISIYLDNKHIGQADKDGDATIELKLDTNTNFTHFTLKIKQDGSFSEILNFSIEYVKEVQDTNTQAKQEDNQTNDATQNQDNSDTNTTTTPQTTTTTNEIISLEFKTTTIELAEGDSYSLHVYATYEDNSKKDITTKLQWIIPNTQHVQITQGNLKALKDGSLTIKARYNSITSNPLSITIYKEINGYRLPPEPNEKLNNSTLLGIDVNNNGVRDDVEIYIINRFALETEYPKTKTAIAMQDAWASQKIIENPVIESVVYDDDAIDCQSYWINKKTKGLSFSKYLEYSLKHEIYNNVEVQDKIFNTKARILQSFKFNKACSGQIFNGRGEETIDNCQTNIDLLGE